MSHLLVGLFWIYVVCGNSDFPNIGKGVWVNKAGGYARCLDGSVPLYYIRTGSPRARNKWVIHQQGESWCSSLEKCYRRSLTRSGSSSTDWWSPWIDFGKIGSCQNARWCGGLFVNDPSKNPLTYDWNAVFLPYCDGGSQIGQKLTVTEYNQKKLYFSGFFVLDAIITDLITSYNLAGATDVIIGGASSGGLSTWLHIDHWAQRLPNSRVVGVPDSGFFREINFQDVGFADHLYWVFDQMNGTESIPLGCRKKFSNDIHKCIFPENLAEFIATPLFVFQSRYDPFQIDKIFGNQSSTDLINQIGKDTDQKLQSFLANSSQSGVFLDSCEHHCGGWGMNQDGDYNIIIDENTGIQAFIDWYTKKTGKRIWNQNYPYPCNACCTGGRQDKSFVQ